MKYLVFLIFITGKKILSDIIEEDNAPQPNDDYDKTKKAGAHSVVIKSQPG